MQIKFWEWLLATTRSETFTFPSAAWTKVEEHKNTKNARTQEHKNTRKQEHKNARTQEHNNTWTQEHKNTITHEHKNTRTQQRKNTRMQEHKNTRTQQRKNTRTHEHKNARPHEHVLQEEHRLRVAKREQDAWVSVYHQQPYIISLATWVKAAAAWKYVPISILKCFYFYIHYVL
jgi:hypothetical protein